MNIFISIDQKNTNYQIMYHLWDTGSRVVVMGQRSGK